MHGLMSYAEGAEAQRELNFDIFGSSCQLAVALFILMGRALARVRKRGCLTALKMQ